jgi:hypothetical protein
MVFFILHCQQTACIAANDGRRVEDSRVRNDNRTTRPVKLIATCGLFDMDDPQPAITVTLADED